MIVTVTPNPSLDRTVEVDRLERGATLRCTGDRLDPGGKGLNVARALVRNATEASAVFPSGGAEGEQLRGLLAAAGVDAEPVGIAAAVRTNITVAEPDGTVTKLNAPGPQLAEADVDNLLAAITKHAASAAWIAGCGSLPPGAPTDFYARLLHSVAGQGCAVAVDSSGDALVQSLDVNPALIKPNRDELAEASGRAIGTLGEAADAAQSLRTRGATAVLVSLGADGALLVDADGVVHGQTGPVTLRSAIGAGDALLAGFLAAGGAGRDALAAALAWGAAAASLPGSRMPGPADLASVDVEVHDRLDANRPLEGS